MARLLQLELILLSANFHTYAIKVRQLNKRQQYVEPNLVQAEVGLVLLEVGWSAACRF